MKLTLTERIREAVQKWGGASERLGEDWIEHCLLVEIGEQLGVPLSVLVRGTAVYMRPPAPKPQKSPEFLELMDRLRFEAQEKEYRELAGLEEEEGAIFGGGDAKQVKEEITTILNFAVSVFAVGFALWYWAKWWDPASRTLLAILGSLVVLVAEVTVYVSYRAKVDEARRVERTREHKSVRVDAVEEVVASAPVPAPGREPAHAGKKKQGTRARARQQAITTGSSTGTVRARVSAH